MRRKSREKRSDYEEPASASAAHRCLWHGLAGQCSLSRYQWRLLRLAIEMVGNGRFPGVKTHGSTLRNTRTGDYGGVVLGICREPRSKSLTAYQVSTARTSNDSSSKLVLPDKRHARGLLTGCCCRATVGAERCTLIFCHGTILPRY